MVINLPSPEGWLYVLAAVWAIGGIALIITGDPLVGGILVGSGVLLALGLRRIQ